MKRFLLFLIYGSVGLLLASAGMTLGQWQVYAAIALIGTSSAVAEHMK